MDELDELRQEGREEGERIGERRGRARALLDLLAARFGPVPAEVRTQILAASKPSLVRWSLRVLTAKSLHAVLAAPTTRPRKPSPARRATRA